MKKLGVYPELTKRYLLERVTQEEIMEYYTNIPVNSTTTTIQFNSPLRPDNTPSANYYYAKDNKGEVRLKLKDWGKGAFNGDIFDVASYFTKIKSNTSQGFKLLLHKIAFDFRIHKYENEEERRELLTILNTYHKTSQLKVFKVTPRAWNVYDERYWYKKYFIGSDLLRIGKVIPIQNLQIEGKDGYLYNNYSYSAKDPAYAYYGGVINGIQIWKIYFPFRLKGRKFLTNYSFIQGLDIFQPARIGIITKSYKDVLCYKLFKIEAIAIPSETYVMSKEEYFNIKSKCDIVLTNFDYDKAGILLANKYKKIHKCSPLMFTRGKYNQPDFGVKDFSEFIEKYGVEATIRMIQNLLNTFEEDLTSINLYNYNSLKWIV